MGFSEPRNLGRKSAHLSGVIFLETHTHLSPEGHVCTRARAQPYSCWVDASFALKWLGGIVYIVLLPLFYLLVTVLPGIMPFEKPVFRIWHYVT